MDIMSHGLWSGGLFGYRKYFWLAVIFGILPDLVSYGLIVIIFSVTGRFDLILADLPLHVIPDWTFVSYDLSHSFVIAFSVIGAIALWKKELAFAMLGWPFHIVLDFPFHPIEYFPTKIFWPISNFVIDGIAWWNSLWICFLNIAGIIILFNWRKRKNYQHLNSDNQS